ncbi:MAG: hypothetical protein AXA67_07315 [Methylothermaceae bacteria B42]|nr:MAG: hypothetical protein AXA67_07315 [Methylothermaceae bacteria B42]HHJ40166.1 glycosyltransferase family 2 protein [Methylothermaceae bacterium]
MNESQRLAVSIVVHNSSLRDLDRSLEALGIAVKEAQRENCLNDVRITMIDNASDQEYLKELKALLQHCQNTGGVVVELIQCAGNLGYGQGHNVAGNNNEDFRLILNPDVFLARDSLSQALNFVKENPEVGVVVPRVLDSDGDVDYLCKRYPSILDLALRGFAPVWLQKMFTKRLHRYEMRDIDWTKPHCQVELASGCCLLMRGEVWLALGGFSPDYFMYFEDFDLSMRAKEITTIAYVPEFEVTHLGGNAARKGWRHILWFIKSAWVFFNKYGWRFW